MTNNGTVIVREFRQGDGPAFRKLNELWITRYFKIEPKDEDSLGHPQSAIIDKGGRIFIALVDETIVGCCALIYRAADEFEVAKMAVAEEQQGKGIGRALLLAAIARARETGIRRLYLETNDSLTPAVRLYESLGFRKLDPATAQNSPYARVNLFMDLNLD